MPPTSSGKKWLYTWKISQIRCFHSVWWQSCRKAISMFSAWFSRLLNVVNWHGSMWLFSLFLILLCMLHYNLSFLPLCKVWLSVLQLVPLHAFLIVSPPNNPYPFSFSLFFSFLQYTYFSSSIQGKRTLFFLHVLHRCFFLSLYNSISLAML